MDFVSFLQQSRNADFWERSFRIGLTGKEYPAFFLSDFFTQIKEVIAPHYTGLQVMDTPTLAMGECMASLETTFLGMRSVYWLKNISDVPASSHKQWFSYVSNYQGPHCIIFFIDASDAATMDDIITIPPAVDKQLFTQLFIFFAGSSGAQRAHSAIQALYTRHTTVPLDTACALIRYLLLMGNQYQLFLDTWLDAFIIPETSLFTLSQHFFARSPQKFLAVWKTIAPSYAEQFWIAFWSEQLWRAYHVVDCLQNSRFVEAKSLSYRLPFSLMQQDWKKLSLHELHHAHNFLYTIDGALKNGGNQGALDLFYSKFFLKQFDYKQ